MVILHGYVMLVYRRVVCFRVSSDPPDFESSQGPGSFMEKLFNEAPGLVYEAGSGRSGSMNCSLEFQGHVLSLTTTNNHFIVFDY